jgi:hypothetical protein
MYLPSHGQAGTAVINIQSKLRTVPQFYKNISLAVLYGNNSNSYTVSTQSDCVCVCVCVYNTHIHTQNLHNVETVVVQKYKTGNVRIT